MKTKHLHHKKTTVAGDHHAGIRSPVALANRFCHTETNPTEEN